MKPKANAYKSDDNTSVDKTIYDEILEERIGEILKISKEMNYKNLVCNFKVPTPSIYFALFRGLMYTYNRLKIVKKHYNK